MKKDFRRKIKIGNYSFEVTDAAPEVYRITLLYDDGYEEVFYRGFYSKYDCERYCIWKLALTSNAVGYYYNYSFTVNFDGGNEDEE